MATEEISTIILPITPDLIGGGTAASYITTIYVIYLQAALGGTQTQVVVGQQSVQVKITPPLKPISGGDSLGNVLLSIPGAVAAKSGITGPPGTSIVNALVFELLAGEATWGAPTSGIYGSILMGGVLHGTNVVVSTLDGGITWYVAGYPPFFLQEIAINYGMSPPRYVGRDASLENYCYSDDTGATWTLGNPAGQAWQGTNSSGFYN